MLQPHSSPHTLQNSDSKYINETFDWSNRILDHDTYPSNVNYEPKSRKDDTTVVHYGRYQLLLNEIEFLILTLRDLFQDYGEIKLKEKKIVVIYGGAAIGSHLSILSSFFPFVEFILYDKAPFRLGLGVIWTRFKIRVSFLNAKIATELRNEYKDGENYIRLFISDIRRNNSEIVVEQDLDLQAEIHEKLQPYRSYLKFRLPYHNGVRLFKEYLDGKIYLLTFGNRSTTETRLYVKQNSGLKNYDCKKFENQMHYFNKYDRTNCYKHDLIVQGFDHCYDCRTVVFILDEYRKILDTHKFLFSPNFQMARKDTKELINLINQKLCSDSKKIEYKLNFDQEFFECEYNFTKMQHGTQINREFLEKIRKASQTSDFESIEKRFSKISIKK